MRSSLILLLVVGAALLETTVLFNRLKIYGLKPDLVLLIVIFASLYRGSSWGALTGFLGGVVEDSFSGGLVGMNCLTKTLVGTFARLPSKWFYIKDLGFQLILTFLLAIFNGLLLILLGTFHTSNLDLIEALKRIPLYGTIQVILSPFIFWGMRKLRC